MDKYTHSERAANLAGAVENDSCRGFRSYTGAGVALFLLVSTTSVLALPWPRNIVAMLLGWTMLAIAVVDLRARIIPDVLSLPTIPAGLLLSGSLFDQTASKLVALDHAIALFAAGGTFAALRYGYRCLRGREGLGLGDVKLAAAAGAWTGPVGVCDVILIASLGALAIVYGKWLIDRGKVPLAEVDIPFGAFLAPATWLVWSLYSAGITELFPY